MNASGGDNGEEASAELAELVAEKEELRKRVAELEERRGNMHEEFLAWRGVEIPCSACQGSGVAVYGGTSTWRGGAGGQTITTGVCDQCWGTGDAHRKGIDLRRLKNERESGYAACEADVTRYLDDAISGIANTLAKSIVLGLRQAITDGEHRDLARKLEESCVKKE